MGTGRATAGASLFLLDEDNERLIPWSTPGTLGGTMLRGLAFLPGDRLLATIDSDSGSQLVELDPATGAIVGSRGLIVAQGAALAIADLAYAPATDRLYGLSADGPTIYEIAIHNATAVRVGTVRPHMSGGIAMHDSGLLVLVGDDGGWFMDLLDPGTGARLGTVDLGPSLGTIESLTSHPSGGFTLAAGDTLFHVAPDTAVITPIAMPSGSTEPLAALAWRALTTPAVVTTVVGMVMGDSGGVLPGVDVHTLGGSTVTDANGAFAFPSLAVGTGVIRTHAVDSGREAVSEPVAPVPGGVTDVGTLVLGGATLGDRVWLDQDGDGVQNEPDAAGLAGIRVSLRDDLGVVLDEALTNADGIYRFRGLAAGTYVVHVETPPPDGQLTTDALPLVVTVAEGETYLDADMGYRIVIDEGMGSIGQRVWHDLDGDGTDPFFSEPGLDDVAVALEGDVDGDGLADLFAQTITGNGLGFYFFGDLPPGTYLIRIDATTLPTGVNQPTYDVDGIATPHSATVAVGPGSIVFDVNFGYRAPQ